MDWREDLGDLFLCLGKASPSQSTGADSFPKVTCPFGFALQWPMSRLGDQLPYWGWKCPRARRPGLCQ